MNKSQRLKQKRLRRHAKRKQASRQSLLAPEQRRAEWEKAVVEGFSKRGWGKPEVKSHIKVIRRSGAVIQDLAYGMEPDEYVKRIAEQVDLNNSDADAVEAPEE